MNCPLGLDKHEQLPSTVIDEATKTKMLLYYPFHKATKTKMLLYYPFHKEIVEFKAQFVCKYKLIYNQIF
jgi:phage regulator Rha-like protein